MKIEDALVPGAVEAWAHWDRQMHVRELVRPAVQLRPRDDLVEVDRVHTSPPRGESGTRRQGLEKLFKVCRTCTCLDIGESAIW